MNLRLKYTAFCVTTILLTGCGASKMAVRPDATAQIQRIALITVQEPAAYTAQDFGNPGMMFGAIGGAVAGSSSANAGKSVNQIAQDADYRAGSQLTNELKARLNNAGYQVELITLTREKENKLLENYQSIDAAGADAVLDVVIENIGYATEHPMLSPHWRPSSQIRVAMVKANSGEKIYSEKFMYGYHNPFISGTDLDAPKEYHFKNKEQLFADGDKLIAGMQKSIVEVAQQVQENLKK